ncbi:hypothetical protein APHWI1_1192 [Anaplasma phagocytophilum str. ApWI1]|uniref:Uncharacterized protein n=1 Tax=Anaplasma phagocytophilum str. ApWI1 TaxID=1359155 RepID=A0A0F3PYF0_ANAPH|nr:hypothetical protein APHWI1_1192 [Anaplasma phagocytophilum str. ApWI1]
MKEIAVISTCAADATSYVSRTLCGDVWAYIPRMFPHW